MVSSHAVTVALRPRLKGFRKLVWIGRDYWIWTRYCEFRRTETSVNFCWYLLLSICKSCFLFDLSNFLRLIGYDHVLLLQYAISLWGVSSMDSCLGSDISWKRCFELSFASSTASRAITSICGNGYISVLNISFWADCSRSLAFKARFRSRFWIGEIAWNKIYLRIRNLFDWIYCRCWLLIKLTNLHKILVNNRSSLLCTVFA